MSLKTIIKILDFLSPLRKFFPIVVKLPIVKEKISEVLLNYFYESHLLPIVKKHAPYYIVDSQKKIELVIYESSFRGFMANCLFNKDFKPTVLNLTVALNISYGTYCNPQHNSNNLIDISYIISEKLNEALTDAGILKYLIEIYKKNLRFEIIDRLQIETVFQAKKNLFVEYFKTYAKANLRSSIKIWHQSEDKTYIDWKEADALIIPLNLAEIREGFFLVGFDYQNSEKGYLKEARRKNGYEYFNENIENSSLIWIP